MQSARARCGSSATACRRLHAAVPAGAIHRGAIRERSGLDVRTRERRRDAALLRSARGADDEAQGRLAGAKLLDELFQALVESKLVQPTFVVDYPVELSPLAKPKRGNPR